MQKKNVLMMTMSLAMVGVVAVGGTLAYLTSNTKTLTNTFTVGEGYDATDFYLDETAKPATGNPEAISLVDRTDTVDGDATVAYEAMSIGDAIAKDPTLHLDDGPESYVFARVEGVDAMIQAGFTVSNTETNNGKYVAGMANGLNTNNWVKVADLQDENDSTDFDGIYVYKVGAGDYTVTPGPNAMERLFASVSIDSARTSLPTLQDNVNDMIKITGAAIQADNMESVAGAWTALKGESAANDFTLGATDVTDIDDIV